MNANLVWSKTGDVYPLDVISPVFLEWLVSELGTNNQFFLVVGSDSTRLLATLEDALLKVNNFWKTHFKKEFFKFNNLYDQQTLNCLHRDWVIIQQKHVGLIDLLNNINQDVAEHFLSINKTLHKLEHSWEWEFEVPRWQVTNPWGCQFNIWQYANVSLDYGNLGRSAWEKFITWGEIDNEYNEMEKISARIHINFSRPRLTKPNKDFQEWCSVNQVLCYPNEIPLGNFVDLVEKQANYKQSFLSNLNLKDNYLTIKL